MAEKGRMSTTSGTGGIHCPFFKAHSLVDIECEGVTDQSVILQHYRRKGDKDVQLLAFCSDRYKYC